MSFAFSASVSFSIDMNDSNLPNDNYDSIVINGSWNDWSGWGVTLNDNDSDGIFEGSLVLPSGTYEYVIAATGPSDNWSGWGEIINAPIGSECDFDSGDSWANYGFILSDADIIQSYCAGTCNFNCNDDGNDDDNEPGNLGDYALVWNDEFDDNVIDNTKWNFEIGTGSWGWGNGEHQYYTDRNVNAFIEDGKLIIQALAENYAGSNYTSARMTTKNKGDWLYGKILARIKVPEAGGTWPAFWMMPTNSVYGGWPHSGEMDIMEHYGCNPGEVSSTVHNNVYNWNGGVPPTSYLYDTSATTDFHIYEMQWSEDELNFYVDGTYIGTYFRTNSGWQQWPYDQEFYIILNLAIGSHFMPCSTQDGLFPQRLEVDYVRVYQQLECGPSGDINNDGDINVVDIVQLVSEILDENSEFSICSDINNDGDVNIVDIVSIVNLIIVD